MIRILINLLENGEGIRDGWYFLFDVFLLPFTCFASAHSFLLFLSFFSILLLIYLLAQCVMLNEMEIPFEYFLFYFFGKQICLRLGIFEVIAHFSYVGTSVLELLRLL
jgi:hypothetical protein